MPVKENRPRAEATPREALAPTLTPSSGDSDGCAVADPICVTLGSAVTLTTLVQTLDPATGQLTPADDDGLKLYLLAPDGTETVWTVTLAEIVRYDTGKYYAVYLPAQIGTWTYRWVGDVTAEGAAEGRFDVESIYAKPTLPPDLTDTRIMVPRARRYIEGPYGPPEKRPPLSDDVVNAMVADAAADIILFSGSLFGHKLVVKQRDAAAGFPTAWGTGEVLEEWEVSVVTTQAALNSFFFLFRELKSSQAIKNEGTEWQYTISVNVIRDYLSELQQRRDLALKGLMNHHPVLDRFASNIRVRDQATVAILEWWATNLPDQAPGLPGGQEAAVVPWVGGVSPIG